MKRMLKSLRKFALKMALRSRTTLPTTPASTGVAAAEDYDEALRRLQARGSFAARLAAFPQEIASSLRPRMRVVYDNIHVVWTALVIFSLLTAAWTFGREYWMDSRPGKAQFASPQHPKFCFECYAPSEGSTAPVPLSASLHVLTSCSRLAYAGIGLQAHALVWKASLQPMTVHVHVAVSGAAGTTVSSLDEIHTLCPTASSYTIKALQGASHASVQWYTHAALSADAAEMAFESLSVLPADSCSCAVLIRDDILWDPEELEGRVRRVTACRRRVDATAACSGDSVMWGRLVDAAEYPLGSMGEIKSVSQQQELAAVDASLARIVDLTMRLPAGGRPLLAPVPQDMARVRSVAGMLILSPAAIRAVLQARDKAFGVDAALWEAAVPHAARGIDVRVDDVGMATQSRDLHTPRHAAGTFVSIPYSRVLPPAAQAHKAAVAKQEDSLCFGLSDYVGRDCRKAAVFVHALSVHGSLVGRCCGFTDVDKP